MKKGILKIHVNKYFSCLLDVCSLVVLYMKVVLRKPICYFIGTYSDQNGACAQPLQDMFCSPTPLAPSTITVNVLNFDHSLLIWPKCWKEVLFKYTYWTGSKRPYSEISEIVNNF